jgi:hypothetical protein
LAKVVFQYNERNFWGGWSKHDWHPFSPFRPRGPAITAINPDGTLVFEGDEPTVVETFPPQTLFGKPVVVDPSLPEVNPTYGMVNFPELAEGE